ncbi:hypothetical protein HAX54_053325 [Datura stramonium]|uniref:Uncharacterized protein n=1 Tax=Datura stramonium TaxID=4076 RepID=A0ABS8WRY1_DATST|nr:hypothetical protein [Datura stramonium]
MVVREGDDVRLLVRENGGVAVVMEFFPVEKFWPEREILVVFDQGFSVTDEDLVGGCLVSPEDEMAEGVWVCEFWSYKRKVKGRLGDFWLVGGGEKKGSA